MLLPATATSETAEPALGESAQQEMIGFRISDSKPPLAEQDPGTKLSYKVGRTGMFEGTLELGNLRPDPHDYLVVLYIDYQQVAFAVDGARTRSHTLRLDPGEVAWMRFAIRGLSAGVHDLSATALSDPSAGVLSQSEQEESASFGLVSARVNLRVSGLDSLPRSPKAAVPTTWAPVFDSTGAMIPGRALEGPSISRSAGDYSQVLTLDATAHQPLRLIVNISNPSEDSRRYALIPTIDGQQPLGAAHRGVVLFAEVPAGTVNTYEVDVTAPSARGYHEIKLVNSIEPFGLLSDPTFWTTQMEQGARIALRVR